MKTTRLSSKGQIIIPQPLVVSEVDGSLLLTPIKAHKRTSVCDVLGCLEYKGPKKSLADIEKAIRDEARKK